MMRQVMLVMVVLLSVVYADKECDSGFVLKKGKCVPCDPGYYHNNKIGMCVPCSFGEYSYKRGSTNCVKCHRMYSETHYQIGSTSCNHNELFKLFGDGYKKAKKTIMEYVK